MGDFLFYFPPFIIFSMLLEYPFVKSRTLGSYELRDTAANIACGLGMLLQNAVLKATLFIPYSFFYQFRLFDLERTWWIFLVLVFAEDYAYYWFHRTSHESRFFWSSHETHHSSTRFNLSTSVRQTWTGYIFSWIFWMPLVLLGFPPEWIIIQQGISLFYQIFIHTEAVGKLGAIEWVMNTPSHHRVHHATNIRYLDKNYAGIFIIWDRLHGTFEKEVETPIYGTLDPITSNNPFVICFHMWIKLVRDVRAADGFINKMKTIFYPPGWRADGKGKLTRDLQNKLITESQA